MDEIIIKENFFEEDELLFLLEAAKINTYWQSQSHDFWKNRVVNLSQLYIKKECPESIEYFLKLISSKINELICNYFFVEKAYVDTIDLVRWPSGKFQSPHVDEIPHKHRKWGSIIYLNNDFYGGETYYPNIDLVVKPKPGMLIIHRGDEIHRHGVTEVSGETRYTISSFWGLEKDKCLWYNHKSIL